MATLRERTLKTLHGWNCDVTRQIQRDLAEVAPQVRGRLLDLGCGSKPYLDLFPGVSDYVGMDLPVTHSANKLEKRADLFGDLGHLPLAGESFDAVLCTQVLEHVPDPGVVLAEAARVLRDDGILVLTIPFMAAEHEEPNDFLRFTSFGIEALLRKSGFGGIRVKKQFGFWSAIGEMIYWHYQRKLAGTGLEKYWFAVGTTLFLRFFHLLNRVDSDKKLVLNLCVTARKVRQQHAQDTLESWAVAAGAARS